MEQIYNKIVRDKIPKIIINNGEEPITRILDDEEEYKSALIKKLYEEYQETINAKNSKDLIEELADLLEIIFSIAKIEKVNQEELLEVMNQKRFKKGGFDNRIFLEKVINNKEKIK